MDQGDENTNLRNPPRHSHKRSVVESNDKIEILDKDNQPVKYHPSSNIKHTKSGTGGMTNDHHSN